MCCRRPGQELTRSSQIRKVKTDSIRGISMLELRLPASHRSGWPAFFANLWSPPSQSSQTRYSVSSALISCPHPSPARVLADSDHPSRLARRGGVKRISVAIYDDIRQALCARLREVSIVAATGLSAHPIPSHPTTANGRPRFSSGVSSIRSTGKPKPSRCTT